MEKLICSCGVICGWAEKTFPITCIYCQHEREQFAAYANGDKDKQYNPWEPFGDGEEFRVHRRGQCAEFIDKIRDLFEEITNGL